MLQGLGFVPCVSEAFIYTRKDGPNSSNKQELYNVKALVSGAFDVVDSGVLEHLMGNQAQW